MKRTLSFLHPSMQMTIYSSSVWRGSQPFLNGMMQAIVKEWTHFKKWVECGGDILEILSWDFFVVVNSLNLWHPSAPYTWNQWILLFQFAISIDLPGLQKRSHFLVLVLRAAIVESLLMSYHQKEILWIPKVPVYSSKVKPGWLRSNNCIITSGVCLCLHNRITWGTLKRILMLRSHF